METVLERQRNAHEIIEQLEQAISDRLLAIPKTQRDVLQLDHEIAEMLETIEVRSHALRTLYEDLDKSREREIASLSAADGLDTFYKQLNEVKDYHRRYPDNVVENFAVQYAVHLPDPTEPLDPEDKITKMFSGEETYGRHLDLITLHSEFINLKRNRTINYTRYLDIFDSFDASTFPTYVKDDPKYVQYLRHLLDYLQSFHRRTLPLEDHTAILASFEADYHKQQSEATNGISDGSAEVKPDGIWCDICQKMYSKQTVYDGHLNSKKHKAGLAKSTTSESPAPSTSASAPNNGHAAKALVNGPATNSKKDIARLEYLISQYGQKFKSIKAATRANVTRKATLTDREWQAEQQSSGLMLRPTKRHKPSSDATGNGDGDGAGGEEDSDPDDDESGKIHNPLNLPLSWDGNPIPVWLYNLYGLGNEYTCEICGNHTYRGPKAFKRHWADTKHVYGLSCLGVAPANMPNYEGVTSINDALAMLEQYKRNQRLLERRRDEAVEVEDESGNVMSEKLYHYLKAQGM